MSLTNVIHKQTGRHGTVINTLPGEGRGRRFRVRFTGRPDNTGTPRGPPREEDVDELDLFRGWSASQLAVFDVEMLGAMHSLTAAERAALRSEKVAIRDNPGSTDHEKYEALRFIRQIDLVTG